MTNENSLIDIDAELSRLWEVQAHRNKIKACLFNLLIYTEKGNRTEYVQSLITSIIEKFPCRIIQIECDSTPQSSQLEVAVNTEHTEKEKVTISCDHIFIQVGETQIKRVLSMILPHFVPDLPTYLLWGEEIKEENPLLNPLLQLSDRVIFDSGMAEDIHAYTKAVLEKIQSVTVDFVDLNWARIACWRQTIAKIFSSPERLDHLFHPEKLTIAYNNPPSPYRNDTQALYLQCWLASRLGWRYIDNTADTTTYQSGKNKFSVSLVPDEQKGVAPGAILLADLSIDGNTYTIQRKGDIPQVIVHIGTPDLCLLPLTLALPSLLKGRAFMKEVFYNKTSDHYRFMLEEINKLHGV